MPTFDFRNVAKSSQETQLTIYIDDLEYNPEMSKLEKIKKVTFKNINGKVTIKGYLDLSKIDLQKVIIIEPRKVTFLDDWSGISKFQFQDPDIDITFTSLSDDYLKRLEENKYKFRAYEGTINNKQKTFTVYLHSFKTIDLDSILQGNGYKNTEQGIFTRDYVGDNNSDENMDEDDDDYKENSYSDNLQIKHIKSDDKRIPKFSQKNNYEEQEKNFVPENKMNRAYKFKEVNDSFIEFSSDEKVGLEKIKKYIESSQIPMKNPTELPPEQILEKSTEQFNHSIKFNFSPINTFCSVDLSTNSLKNEYSIKESKVLVENRKQESEKFENYIELMKEHSQREENSSIAEHKIILEKYIEFLNKNYKDAKEEVFTLELFKILFLYDRNSIIAEKNAKKLLTELLIRYKHTNYNKNFQNHSSTTHNMILFAIVNGQIRKAIDISTKNHMPFIALMLSQLNNSTRKISLEKTLDNVHGRTNFKGGAEKIYNVQSEKRSIISEEYCDWINILLQFLLFRSDQGDTIQSIVKMFNDFLAENDKKPHIHPKLDPENIDYNYVLIQIYYAYCFKEIDLFEEMIKKLSYSNIRYKNHSLQFIISCMMKDRLCEDNSQDIDITICHRLHSELLRKVLDEIEDFEKINDLLRLVNIPEVIRNQYLNIYETPKSDL